MPQPPDAAPRAQTQGAESGAALAAKLAIELGPLLVFFGVNAAAGIYGATAAFMAVTLIALAAAWWRYHKLPVMLLVSGAVVLVFGTLTLYLRDDTFIKLKPTIVYLTFAAFLGVGLLAQEAGARAAARLGVQSDRARLAQAHAALGPVLHRHGGLNELVWRNVSTNAWVSFKAFGFLPLTFLFALAQMPLMQRYSETQDSKDAGPKLPERVVYV